MHHRISSEITLINNTSNTFYQKGISNYGDQSVLIGISPGNNFFREDTIRHIINAFSNSSPFIYILIPDTPYIYNFQGLGYDEAHARRKANKDVNSMKNRLNRSLQNVCNPERIKVIDWQPEVEKNHYFQYCRQTVLDAYNEDEYFSSNINSLCEKYLKARSNGRGDRLLDVEKGSYYYLNELSFFAAMGEIIKDWPSIAYYKNWEVGLDPVVELHPELSNKISLLEYRVEQEIVDLV